MSDSNTFSQPYVDALSKFVPGFDFLQGLVKNAGTAMPGIGQWVAPTLDPQELERRISELRTVQFWLEQNARMIGTTIQALEVQRMTLGTLKSMNVSLGDLGEALKVRMPESAPAAPAPAPAPAAAAASAQASDDAPGDAEATGAIDPMQWWGALTQQFTQLASHAMKATTEATAEAAAQASQAMQASSTAAADAQARAADAVQEVIQTVTETVAVVPGMPVAKKRAARKTAATPEAAAPKPAAAPKARKSAAKSAKG